MSEKKGFTLIELLVTLAILTVALAITYKGYLTVLKVQKQQIDISAKNLSIPMAIETIRRDIEMAGFGIPRITAGSCSEAVADTKYTPDPTVLNTNCSPLMPFSVSDNTGANQSDILAVRASIADLNKFTRHWGYISPDGYEEKGDSVSNIDDVVFNVIDPVDMSLLRVPCRLKDLGSIKRTYLVYGLGDSSVVMPFNRVDYYLYRNSSAFSKCSPNTYNLYRAVIKQSDGKRNGEPILSCVRDFQVVFGLDENGNGKIEKTEWKTKLPNKLYDLDKQLKQVRVYILFQEGKKDMNFTFKNKITLGDSDVGTIKEFTPTGDETHYRWRVIRITAVPINLTIRKRNLK